MSWPICIACAFSLFAHTAQLSAQSTTSETPPPAPAAEPTGVEKLKAEAAALTPLATTEVARRFLDATSDLPLIAPRTIYRRPTTGEWFTGAMAQAMPEEDRAAIKPVNVTETFYYYTGYGSPLAYFRVIDVAGQNGFNALAGKKILDFGYGSIGHLRNMASCGAEVVGMDIDSLLDVMYSEPSDTGEVPSTANVQGRVELVTGRFSNPAIVEAVGTGFDLITSKNTLKRGYLHPPPEEQVDKRMLVDLGVSDDDFVQTMFHALKPGGLFIIYNLSVRLKPDQKYNPASDGRCPFERERLEKIGFEVLHFDASDNDAAHAMAKTLGWDQGQHGMNIDDLAALYTVLRKPRYD